MKREWRAFFSFLFHFIMTFAGDLDSFPCSLSVLFLSFKTHPKQGNDKFGTNEATLVWLWGRKYKESRTLWLSFCSPIEWIHLVMKRLLSSLIHVLLPALNVLQSLETNSSRTASQKKRRRELEVKGLSHWLSQLNFDSGVSFLLNFTVFLFCNFTHFDSNVHLHDSHVPILSFSGWQKAREKSSSWCQSWATAETETNVIRRM